MRQERVTPSSCPVCGVTGDRSIGLSGPDFDVCSGYCFFAFHDVHARMRAHGHTNHISDPNLRTRELDRLTVVELRRILHSREVTGD